MCRPDPSPYFSLFLYEMRRKLSKKGKEKEEE